MLQRVDILQQKTGIWGGLSNSISPWRVLKATDNPFSHRNVCNFLLKLFVPLTKDQWKATHTTFNSVTLTLPCVKFSLLAEVNWVLHSYPFQFKYIILVTVATGGQTCFSDPTLNLECGLQWAWLARIFLLCGLDCDRVYLSCQCQMRSDNLYWL